MTRITALAQVDYTTGYGIDACQKILGLINRGWNIYVRPTRYEDKPEGPVPYAIQERLVYHPTDSEWELQITPPWTEPTKGKKTILCTTLEATGTIKEAISVMSRVRAIIVPSKWNANSIKALGIKTPVYVCPESIDQIFRYRKSKYDDDGVFTFGCAGNKGSGMRRKNFELVIRAFQSAFDWTGEKVRLKIKTDTPFSFPITDPRIEVHTSAMAPQDLADWYASLDVFVSASSGEAWGRMVHEAMGTGRPIVAPHCGGAVELMHPEDCITVPWSMAAAGSEYEGCGRWFEIHEGNLMAAMVRAHQMALDERMAIGKRLSHKAHEFNKEAPETMERILFQLGIQKFQGRLGYEIKTDEDRIINFYRDQDEVPKVPVPWEFRFKNLTNTPKGIGDTMLLTPFANIRRVWSTSESFPTLMYFCPEYRDWIPRDLICADRLQKRYAMGNGHLIQRLHRVFGLEPPLKPKGSLEVKGVDRVKNRVAINLLPGHAHVSWQRRYIHPRAREVYDETVKGLQGFVRDHGGYHWCEIGSKRSNWINEAQDKTGIGLFETIRFLATCEYYVGVISGPMHIAAALDVKCIVIINFPDANRIFLPTLKDIPQVEQEWFLPQAVHLHQESDGPLVKRFSVDNLAKAFDGGIYPYFDDRFLPLIHEKL